LSVAAFVSRSVLHVRSNGGGGAKLGTFSFSDALSRYGTGLTEAELANAYKRAGSAFKGQLQQNFVVLTENGGRDVAQMARVEAPRRRNGVDARKRPREMGPSGSGMATFRTKFVKKN
jgi:hypothetical protein